MQRKAAGWCWWEKEAEEETKSTADTMAREPALGHLLAQGQWAGAGWPGLPYPVWSTAQAGRGRSPWLRQHGESDTRGPHDHAHLKEPHTRNRPDCASYSTWLSLARISRVFLGSFLPRPRPTGTTGNAHRSLSGVLTRGAETTSTRES